MPLAAVVVDGPPRSADRCDAPLAALSRSGCRSRGPHPSGFSERVRAGSSWRRGVAARFLRHSKIRAMFALFMALLAFLQTPDIHYVPTSDAVVNLMLDTAGVTSKDVVYDLGSGDGRIVIAAAKKYGARGVGVELDADLIKQATRNAQKAGVADKVRFIQGDLFKTDLSEATVVTMYLSQTINQRLEPKLKRELKPGSRVVSHRFPMPPTWKPDKSISAHGTSVLLWTIR